MKAAFASPYLVLHSLEYTTMRGDASDRDARARALFVMFNNTEATQSHACSSRGTGAHTPVRFFRPALSRVSTTACYVPIPGSRRQYPPTFCRANPPAGASGCRGGTHHRLEGYRS